MDKILIVDDDKFMLTVLQKSLLGQYETRVATSGEEGIVAAEHWQPNVILLDVEMPGQNGYEVCDRIKQNKHTCDIPIIFLSGKSSLRERMLGYEVGGDDYLVKPCDISELNAKLTKIIQHSRDKQDLRASVKNAHQTAMEAMSISSELGKSVRFVEWSYTATDIDSLSKMLVEFCRDLELIAVAMLVGRKGPCFYSTAADGATPLETEVMEMLRQKGRFIDFGCRTQVNYSRVSLLIKNMPLDNRTRYGRIKDTLPFVLSAADSKMRVLEVDRVLMAQTSRLTESVDVVRMALSSIEGRFQNTSKAVSSIVSELTSTLTLDMRRMGMDEDQENWVADQVEAASKGIYACMEKNTEIEEVLTDTVSMLEALIEIQNKVIIETFGSSTDTVENKFNDIELF